MARLRMAVIGVGHLGKEHARILAGFPDVDLVGVADLNFDQAQAIARRYGCQAFANHRPLLSLIDAAVIAVPTSQHHALAGECLRSGIALLVEKPLACTLEQADDLVEWARRERLVLQVGHIERFNPAYEELRRHIFQPKFIECERLGPFTGRSTDIGVVLDLMIHDLDLLLTLSPAPVRSVEALGVSVLGGHEDVANARVSFANGCVANITASRASRAPQRKMRIWSPEGYAGIDFAKCRLTLIQPSAELRRHGLVAGKLPPAPRGILKDELFGRYLQVLERECSTGSDSLTRELKHFVHCIRTGTRPRVSGDEGRDAIALASRILESIHRHSWEGFPGGPTGPTQLPAPRGIFFGPTVDGLAA
jgi:predicted dehydrogenase